LSSFNLFKSLSSKLRDATNFIETFFKKFESDVERLTSRFAIKMKKIFGFLLLALSVACLHGEPDVKVKVGEVGLLQYLKGLYPLKSEVEALKKQIEVLKTSPHRAILSCTTKYTPCALGGGKHHKLEFLDRQRIECGENEVLRKFRFVRCDTNTARYQFDCCTIHVSV